MRKLGIRIFTFLSLTAALALSAFPSTVNVGYVSFDLIFSPNVGQFDITNETGPNSTPSPDGTFPVTNSISLTSLSLLVNFQTGPSSTYGSSYFTLASDGLSFDGTPSFNEASDPVTSAVLTGTFAATSFTLNDGSTITVNPGFSASITDGSGTLVDGDFALITASSSSSILTPEPGSGLLFFGGLVLLLFGLWRSHVRKITSVIALLAAAVMLIPSADAQSTVRLNTATTPSTGVAGSNQVYVAGSGFPNPIVPSAVTVTLAASCGGTAVATAPGLRVTQVVGTSDRVEFLIPASLSSGAYYVSVSGANTGGTTFSSSTCSLLQVTNSSKVLGSCNPGSSMGILVPNSVSGTTVPVTAYVPRAYWGGGTTGVEVVPIEGSGTQSLISTANSINSCSTNSVTGNSVCTANGFPAEIYILNGSSVTTTLTSASNATSGFSGGACYNCGVAVNSVANQAVITMGYSGSASALQFLDLNTNTLGPVVPTTHEVSEDVLWDPFSNLILSPNEEAIFDIFQITGGGIPSPTTVNEAALNTGLSYQDSAGEDCTTGIAITGQEGSGQILLADLKQAAFSGATWTAPHATYNLPEFNNLSAGSSAIAVAPGSTHLGVVAGEFGGNYIGVIQLPATSGSGTPVIVDYVLAQLPATPDGYGFSNGYDPHTTTAYTSPNTQKAYGVAASWATGTPAYVAVIDLQAMLAATRSGTHTVSSSVNLLTSGIVRYVKATP